jgi:hypothetical protein
MLIALISFAAAMSHDRRQAITYLIIGTVGFSILWLAPRISKDNNR